MFGWMEDRGLGGGCLPLRTLTCYICCCKVCVVETVLDVTPTLSTVIDVCGRKKCLVRVEDVAFTRAEVVDHAVVVVVVMCMK